MEKNYKLIIIVLIVLMILVSIIGGVLYFATDAFKSNENLFKKYLAQDIKNISTVFDYSKEKEYIDFIRKNNHTESSDINISFLENENDQEEIYNIKTEGINNFLERALYKDIKANYGSEELAHIELLRQNEIYGFRLSNLVQQFVSIENATMYYVVSNLGYNGKFFQERMNLDEFDFSGLFDFTDEEIQTLKENYYNAIFSDINQNSYSSKNKVMITLNNGESITTKQYTLTLSKTELDKIYKRVLKQAIDDQIILSKLEMIDKEIIEAGFNEYNDQSLKNLYVSKLQEIYDSIEYLGQNDKTIKFNIYQSKGITYRTSMKTELGEYILDLNKKNGTELSYKIVKLTQEGEDVAVYSIKKGLDNSKIFTYKNNNQNIEVGVGEEVLENEINIIANILYKSNNVSRLKIDLKSKIDFSNLNKIEEKFTDKNNIILNNYENNTIDNIFSTLRTRIIGNLEQNQSKIKTKLMNNIMLWIDKKENERINEEKNKHDMDVQRFNNKFVLYEGENIEFDILKKLLITAGKNMKEYVVEEVNGKKQLKLIIQSGNKNEAATNKIIQSWEKSRNTYNIKMEYSDDGYINAIDISVYENK